MAKRPFENVAQFICLGMTVTDQNLIDLGGNKEEIEFG
jgi:hypothetical protein